MSSGRKRATDRHYSAEDQALDQISKEAEERIQARRQARAEAREIRLREIERQQKEEEERQKGTDSKSVSSYSGSRRGSNDSIESDVSSKDSRDPKDQVRNIKHQLRELEDKYKAAMVTNAQLDNTKTSQVFQLELLKEQLEEQEESMIEVQREYKDKCREYELLKRDFESLKLDCDGIKQQIDIKDKLLKESGLVIIATEEGEFSLTKCSNMSDVPTQELGSAIISEEAAELLKKAGEGTLGKSQSNEKVNSLNSQKEVSDSCVMNEVKGHVNSDLVEGEDVYKADLNTVEAASVVDSKFTDVQTANTNEDVKINSNEDENKNERDDKEVDSSKTDYVVVEKDKNEYLEPKNSEDISEHDEQKGENEMRQTGSTCYESDENEVFYESKSELSPKRSEVEDGLIERKEKNGVPDLGKQQESGGVQIKVECEETESGTLVVSEKADREGRNDSINLNVSKKTPSKYESENVVVKRRSESDNVRRVLASESVISMESDVTYHSESEDADIFMEDGKEEDEKASNVYISIESEMSIDVNVGDSVAVMQEQQSIESAERTLGYTDVENLNKDVSVEFTSDNKTIGNADTNITESDVEVAVSPDVVRDNEVLHNVDDSGSSECRQGNQESSNDGGSFENGTDSAETVVSHKFTGIVAREKKKTESLDHRKMILIPDVEGFVPESEVCTSLSANDEVFMSLPLSEMGYDQSMIEFAKGYVTDIVLKSVDLYNKKSKDEKITVRKESYTSENIDICIPKRHYSEELVDTASEIIPRKLSSGSVEILSPVVHLPSENKGDLKFFTYKVDTDADVVLTSIEEEKNPLEGLVTIDSVHSPISGFGICYSGFEGHSDLDSEDDESDDSDGVVLETNNSSSQMVPEFISMPVAIANSVDENTKAVSCGSEYIDKDLNNDLANAAAGGNVAETDDDIEEKDNNMVENVIGDVEGSGNLAVKREGESLSDINDGEKNDEVGAQIKSNVEEEMKDKVDEGNRHVEGVTGVCTDENDISEDSKEDVSEGGTEASSRLSEEFSPHKEGAKETDTDHKLKKILAEQKCLQEEINTLTNKLDEERSKKDSNAPKSNPMNGPELQLYEVQREASKQIHEYKLKLQKAEQEITNLDGSVNRLETQVKRFKYDAEEAEKLEEELKSDRRRLQRELRECQNQIEELQNQNKHLTKRLEKIRQTRSALGVNT